MQVSEIFDKIVIVADKWMSVNWSGDFFSDQIMLQFFAEYHGITDDDEAHTKLDDKTEAPEQEQRDFRVWLYFNHINPEFINALGEDNEPAEEAPEEAQTVVEWEGKRYNLQLSICEDMYTPNTFWLSHGCEFWEGNIGTEEDKGRAGEKDLTVEFDSSEPEVDDVLGLLELIKEKCYQYLYAHRHIGVYIGVFTS